MVSRVAAGGRQGQGNKSADLGREIGRIAKENHGGPIQSNITLELRVSEVTCARNRSYRIPKKITDRIGESAHMLQKKILEIAAEMEKMDDNRGEEYKTHAIYIDKLDVFGHVDAEGKKSTLIVGRCSVEGKQKCPGDDNEWSSVYPVGAQDIQIVLATSDEMAQYAHFAKQILGSTE